MMATYYSFYEYFSGIGVGGTGYATAANAFYVAKGDNVYADAWACASDGTNLASGGYGCFYLYDYTTNPPQVFSTALSAINTFQGQSAEAIIELPLETGVQPVLPNYGKVQVSFDAFLNGDDTNYSWTKNKNPGNAPTPWNLVSANGTYPLETVVMPSGGFNGTLFTFMNSN